MSASESFLADFLECLKLVSVGPAHSARTAASVSQWNMSEKVSLAAAAARSGPQLSAARHCICFIGRVLMILLHTCLWFTAEYTLLYMSSLAAQQQ